MLDQDEDEVVNSGLVLAAERMNGAEAPESLSILDDEMEGVE